MRWKRSLLVASALGVLACGGDDGDGAADARSACLATTAAAAASPARHAVAVRTGDGLRVFVERDGGIQEVFAAPGLAHFTTLAWGDLDGDGREAIAFTLLDPVEGHIGQIFEDRGNGLTNVATVRQTEDLTWLDANGDGRADVWRGDAIDQVLCSDGARLVSCWEGDLDRGMRQVEAGDADGDGVEEVAVAASDSIRVYANRGGAFEVITRLDPQSPSIEDSLLPYDVEWVDLDGCEGDELAVLVYANNEVRYLVFASAGGDLQLVQEGVSPWGAESFAWADYDGDGDFAPATYGSVGSGIQVFDRVGDSYELAFTLADGRGEPAWGDVDGDGDVDLAYLSVDDELVVLRNTVGTFAEIARAPVPRATTVAWGRCGADSSVACFPEDGPLASGR